MQRVSAAREEQEVERKERASDPLVLHRVPQLVAPDRGGRLARGDDHVAERDRGVAAARQDQTREAAVADVKEASVPETRTRTREDPDEVPDGIGVVREEA